jgi:hypothetical protein
LCSRFQTPVLAAGVAGGVSFFASESEPFFSSALLSELSEWEVTVRERRGRGAAAGREGTLAQAAELDRRRSCSLSQLLTRLKGKLFSFGCSRACFLNER